MVVIARGWRRRISRFRLVEGEAAPWYMGVAWVDYWRDQVVVLPVPLNIVAGLCRRFWLWIRSPWTSQFTRGERRCFEMGMKAGRWESEVLRAKKP